MRENCVYQKSGFAPAGKGHLYDGIAVLKIVWDQKKNPVDYVFSEFHFVYDVQGFNREEIIGKSIKGVLSAEEARTLIEKVENSIRSGMPAKFEKYIRSVNRWFCVQAYYRNEQNALTVQFSESDSERKEMEGKNRNASCMKDILIMESIHKIYQAADALKKEQDIGAAFLKQVLELTGSKYGCVNSMKGRFDINVTGQVNGAQAARCKIQRGSFAQTDWWNSTMDGKPFLLNGVQIAPGGGENPHPLICSILALPLMENNVPVAAVAVANREGGYTENEKKTVALLGKTFIQALMQKRVKKEAERHAAFRDTIFSLSKKFINMPQDEVDEGIRQAMELVAEYCCADTSAVFRCNWDGDMAIRLYSWNRAGEEPRTECWRGLRISDIPEAVAANRKGEACIIEKMETEKAASRDYETLINGRKCRQAASFPLVTEGRLWGFLGFTMKRNGKAWDEDEICTVKIFAEILLAALLRKEQESALKISDEKYSTLFHSIDEGFTLFEVLFDTEGHPLDMVCAEANEAAELLLEQKLLGRHLGEIISGFEPKLLETALKVAVTGQSERLEQYDAKRDMWFHMLLFMTGGNGRLIGITFFNITEQKREILHNAFLDDITSEISKFTNRGGIMLIAGEKMKQYFAADQLLLAAVDEEADEAVATYVPDGEHAAREVRLRLRDPLWSGMLAAAGTGEAFYSNDTAADPRYESCREDFRRRRIAAQLVVPFTKDGAVCFAVVMHCRRPRYWRKDEIELLKKISARLYAQIERAVAREALQAAEMQYRRIVTTANEGIWMTDRLGKITYTNRMMAKWMGYDAEEMLGRLATDFVGPDAFRPCYDQWINCGSGIEERADLKIRTKDGGFIWAIVSSTLIKDSEDNYAGSLTMFTNITERKEAEMKLGFQAHLLSCVNDAICVMDREFTILYWNETAEKMYGWTAGEALGQKSLQIFCPEYQGNAREALIEKMLADGCFRGDILFHHKDGREIWTAIHINVIRDEKGEVVELVTSLRDISERKENERRLEEKERDYLEIIDSSTEGSFIIDPEKGEIQYSTEWKKRLGIEHLSPKEAVETIITYSHPDDVEGIMRAYACAAENRSPRMKMEFRAKTVDAGYIWILGQAKIIYNEEGKPVKYFGTHIDITERKRRELNAALLDEIGTDLSRISTGGENIRKAAEKIRNYFSADRLLLMDVDEAADEIAVLYESKEAAFPAAAPSFLLSGCRNCFWMRELQGGRVAVLQDLLTEAEHADCHFWCESVRAQMIAPFINEGKLCFMIAVQNGLPRQWRRDEVELLRELTARLCLHIERARAEAALQASEEKYRKIVTTANEGILVTDNRGRIHFVNEILARGMGYHTEELLGRDIAEFFKTEELINKGKRWDANSGERYDVKLKKKSGEDCWFIISTTPLNDIFGIKVGILAMFTDITDRKGAEMKLALQANLLANVHDAICAADERGRITYWNEMAERMFGWPAQEAIGQYSEDVLGSAVFGYANDEIKETLFQNGYFTGDIRCRKKDGKEIYVSVHSGRVKNESGEDGDFVSLFRDVTARRKTIEALKNSEYQLRKQDQQKNTFLSSLSHELRNPLAIITAGLQLLNASEDKYQTEKAKKIMERQTGQLSRLVDELLDLTRINYNKIVLKKERVELNRLIVQAEEDYAALFEAKGVRLKTKIEADPLFVDADPVRIKQIVGNLLQNALKFTETGGIALLMLHEDKNEAVICVKDSGIGIVPEVLPGLFVPFKQVENSLDRQNGGLGLGLSIAKSIAELHGGSVSAYSEGLGFGSSFFIRLPICLQATARSEGCSEVLGQKQRLNILLIEDNRDLVQILSIILEQMGHTVFAAYDGASGLEKAAQSRPDIILCDIGLPGMNGYEIAKSIRADSLLKNTVLVALTGYAGENDKKMALESGFNLHAAKPVGQQTLEWILSEIKSSNIYH